MSRDGSPADVLVELMRGFVVSSALHAVADLGLADHMSTEPRPAADIARAASCEPAAVTRLLRALCSSGVMHQPVPGAFSLTPVGELLRAESPSLRDWVLLNGDVVYRAFTQSAETFRTGEPAFPRVFGVPMFEHLAAHPRDGALFDAAMRTMTAGAARLVLDAGESDGVRTVVDVGGGDGTLLVELLAAMPDARGILVDLAEVVARARSRPEVAALGGRLEARAGSFFEPLPVGADLYLLAWILHDWDDADAARILASCRDAMTPASRLLVLESVLPPGDDPHFSRYGDLVMMVLFGGRERTLQEYEDLFGSQGLQLHALYTTAGRRSVLDVRLAT